MYKGNIVGILYIPIQEINIKIHYIKILNTVALFETQAFWLILLVYLLDTGAAP